MILVIATFIITAVFVGYHAAQEPSEKLAEGNGVSEESEILHNQQKQTIHSLHIDADLMEMIK